MRRRLGLHLAHKGFTVRLFDVHPPLCLTTAAAAAAAAATATVTAAAAAAGSTGSGDHHSSDHETDATTAGRNNGSGGSMGHAAVAGAMAVAAAVAVVAKPLHTPARGVLCFEQGDIRDPAAVLHALRGADAVFHIASYGMSGREARRADLIHQVRSEV